MNRKGKAVCALLLVQLLAWGVFVPTADAGKLVRLSAQFRRFDSLIDATSAAPSATPGAGGVQVYSKSFSIPAPASGQQAVVFITVMGTAQHGGGANTAVLVSCVLDGSFCNPGANPVTGVPAGWATLLYDFGDTTQRNVVNYTWCAKVSSGTHTATIRMASQDGLNSVVLWHAHFFIDRTELKTSTADDCELGAP